MSLTNLRDYARQIFIAALQAVDARAATQRAISLNDSLFKVRATVIEITGRPIYVVAIGKAAGTMATGLADVLGSKISKGIICGPAQENPHLSGWQTFVGGHPLPTSESLAAARATLELLNRAEEGALIMFLISGGGSAMFELPIDEKISIDDLREANRQLVSCGATIAEINSVRRAFSAVKGGKLASAAPQAEQISLIVSDTNIGDEAWVASGPSVEPDAKGHEAREVVRRYGLVNRLPRSILEAIAKNDEKPRSPTQHLRVHYVLLDNRTALEAAAREASKMGFVVEIASDINEQEISVGCDLLLSRAESLWGQHGGRPVCLISGGEFSCRVRGNGLGGRNSEAVLQCLSKINNPNHNTRFPTVWTILMAGSDGIDGNSPAAGAIADETTSTLGKLLNLDPVDFIERSDSFTYFNAIGNTIITGTTNTNVRDIRLILTS